MEYLGTILNVLTFALLIRNGIGNEPCIQSSTGYKVVTKTYRNSTHTLKVNKTIPLETPPNTNPCPNPEAAPLPMSPSSMDSGNSGGQANLSGAANSSGQTNLGGQANSSGQANSGVQEAVEIEEYTVHGYTVKGSNCRGQKPVCPTEKKIPVQFSIAKETVTGDAAENLYWVTLNRENVIACLKDTTPATTGSPPQFVCRALYNGFWVPGTLNFESCTFACEIDNLNWETVSVPIESYGDVQLLIYQGAYIIYVPFAEDDTQHTKIYGGNFDDGTDAWLCRYKDPGGSVFIGRYLRPWIECFYVKNGVQERGRDTTLMEFSVLNADRSDICPTLKRSCPESAKEPVEIGPDRKQQPTDNIYWKPVTTDGVEACSKTTDSSNGQFVCRTQHDGRWISGRLEIGRYPCKVTCDIAVEDKSVRVPIENNQKTQLLIFKSGLRWIDFNADVQDKLVYGGVFDDDIVGGEKAYICRYKHDDGKVYVGRYLLQWKECWITPSIFYYEVRGKETSKMQLLVAS